MTSRLARAKSLRPEHRPGVVLEERVLAFDEVGQVAVGQGMTELLLLQLLARLLDEVGADPIADPTAAGVQHDPEPVGFVETELDEVVARAERAEVDHRVGAGHRRVLVLDPSQALGEAAGAKAGGDPSRDVLAPAGRLALAAVRHRLFDDTPQTGQAVRQVFRRQAGLHRHHAAADVDTDGGRDDGALGGDHAADGGALAPVHVGHGRDVTVNEGQPGDIDELLARGVLDRDALGPGLDDRGAGFDDLITGHGSTPFRHALPKQKTSRGDCLGGCLDPTVSCG